MYDKRTIKTISSDILTRDSTIEGTMTPEIEDLKNNISQENLMKVIQLIHIEIGKEIENNEDSDEIYWAELEAKQSLLDELVDLIDIILIKEYNHKKKG